MRKKNPRRKDPLRSLVAQLAGDCRKMKDLYGKKDGPKLLAAFLKQRAAVIMTPDYKKVWGGASARIWMKARASGARLEVRPVHIYFGNAIGPRTVRGQVFDRAAFVILEIHLTEKARRGRRNATGYLMVPYGHQELCPWF